jgi:Mor family transcriptional regulator
MITLDDFPDNFRDIAEAIGVDAAVALCKLTGGTQIYIPKIDRIGTTARNQALYKEFSAGKSYPQLAIEYNLSERAVREIITELYKQRPTIEDFI